MKTKFYNHIVQLQKTICDKFEKIDGKARFFEDKWTRNAGGGGITNNERKYNCLSLPFVVLIRKCRAMGLAQ